MSNEKDFVVEVSFEFQFLIGKVQRYFYMTFQDEAKDLFQFLRGKVQRNST